MEIDKTFRPLLKFDKFYPDSLTEREGTILFLIKKGGKKLLVIAEARDTVKSDIEKFEGEEYACEDYQVKVCPLTSPNAASLRKLCPFTRPVAVGNKTGFGLGDRLGNATPGHVRAASKFNVVPVFAQQSIREMTRTGRTPQQVMDEAAWGIFQEHYTRPFGADADHLKTTEDIETCFKAGFTMFTVDPSDHINNQADGMSVEELESAFEGLFDDRKQKEFLLNTYLGRTFESEGLQSSFKDEEIKRASVKYLQAIKQVIKMYKHLSQLHGEKPFDFEVSIDETDLPTLTSDHFFIITQLKEQGVKVTSLAPRFVGEFQKAIDYIGDIQKFTSVLEQHTAIARQYGNYKLSIHSGSDKFSIFGVVGRVTQGLFHEKTAGTSYLEAIRTVARKVPDFYRQIHKFALSRFEQDRVSYHVTTDLKAIPDVDQIADEELEELFDEDNTRQLIHITYGSVLQAKDENDQYIFRDRLMQILDKNEEEYFGLLERHISRHMESLGLGKLLTLF